LLFQLGVFHPISTLLQIYTFILIARLIISWFPHPPDWARPVYTFLYVMTEPVLRLVRPLVPPLRMGAMALDLSPILIFVVLQILTTIFQRQGL
jgi:YggT family protein